MQRIALPNKDGFDYVPVDDIIYFKSDMNFSIVSLTTTGVTNKHVLKSISQLEIELKPHHFTRSHNQYLVNINHVIRFEKSEGGVIVVSNEVRIPLARARKHKFLSQLRNLK